MSQQIHIRAAETHKLRWLASTSVYPRIRREAAKELQRREDHSLCPSGAGCTRFACNLIHA